MRVLSRKDLFIVSTDAISLEPILVNVRTGEVIGPLRPWGAK